MKSILQLIEIACENRASDIHIVCGLPVKYRIDGQLEHLDNEIMTKDDCISYAKALCNELYKVVEEVGEVDIAKTLNESRCRIHIFKQQGIPSIALRILHDHIPELTELGLPPSVYNLTKLHKGIVLVTGETGSGKSTTLAALLNQINHTRKAHIVTLEDPIEYVYTPDLCVINQREVGKDTRSFSEGLRASLREDPDVILIGEMRDKETIETAITAAETGHLVFGTLHTASAADAIDRMVQVFSDGMQNQIRLQLSQVLQAVLSQQLLPHREKGRVLACEYMVVNAAIKNNIRQGNVSSIENTIKTSKELGCQSMDQSLIQLARNRLIKRDVAYEYAKEIDFVKKYI